MFERVADLYHDLDEGMKPISVLFPYLPTAFHRKRDAARAALADIFRGIIMVRRAAGAKEDDLLQVRAPASAAAACAAALAAAVKALLASTHAHTPHPPAHLPSLCPPTPPTQHIHTNTQHLIDARYQKVNGGRELTTDEITGLMIAILFAGQHTSSVTSSWTGLYMIANPATWKVRRRVVAGGRASGG